MAYKELRKLYYGDEDAYKNEYATRFHSEAAIHLDFDIVGKQAFFLQTPDVIQAMYQILKLDKEVYRLSSKLPGVAKDQYFKKCLIDEIVLTNKIEGVHSSRKEIGEALAILEAQSHARGKRHRFVGLVNKYLKLSHGESLALETCQDIRSIYDEVFLEEVVAEDPGNAPDGKIFRKDQTTIRSATDRVIHEGLMPETRIITSMEKALAFLNDASVESLYRICIFHYMMEYIHPFYDGNGRLGRFIVSYCISETLEPLLAYRISEVLKENIKDYYHAFEVCNDPHNLGDLTPFLLMMLHMILTALEELKNSLSRKLISWKRYGKVIGILCEGSSDPKLSAMYDCLTQAALFSEQGISTKELIALSGVSYGTVKNLLKTIDSAGMLVGVKHGKEKYYQIDLRAMDDFLLDPHDLF